MALKKKVIQGGLDVQKSDGTSAFALDETAGTATMNDALSTQLGLKQYLHGTNYNGGNAPTVSSALSGFSVTRAVFIPYKAQGGEWRVRFNISTTCTSGTRSSASVSINGIAAKNVSLYVQPVTMETNGAVSSLLNASITPNSGTIGTNHASDTISRYSFSGDIELDSKPTWAY